ncbi:MAG: hypothetical protein ABII02_04900 [Candidatus Magasanikbacteria bacterium]
MKHQRLATYLIRLGIAIAFLYAAVASFLDPGWINFLPGWFIDTGFARAFLILFSLAEIALSLWLLSGKRIYEAGLVTAGVTFIIVLINYSALDLVFRDIPIIFAALALSILEKKE